MRSNFHRLCKPEIDFLIDNCNFSNADCILLKMAGAGKSNIEIADSLSISSSTVIKRKKVIAQKISDFIKEMDNMTTIYVNGKRVTKEELEKMEIKIESIKRILTEKLTVKK